MREREREWWNWFLKPHSLSLLFSLPFLLTWRKPSCSPPGLTMEGVWRANLEAKWWDFDIRDRGGKQADRDVVLRWTRKRIYQSSVIVKTFRAEFVSQLEFLFLWKVKQVVRSEAADFRLWWVCQPYFLITILFDRVRCTFNRHFGNVLDKMEFPLRWSESRGGRRGTNSFLHYNLFFDIFIKKQIFTFGFLSRVLFRPFLFNKCAH